MGRAVNGDLKFIPNKNTNVEIVLEDGIALAWHGMALNDALF